MRAHKLLRPLFNLCYTDGFACGEEAGKWLFENKKFVVLKNGTDTNKYRFNDIAREDIRRQWNAEDKIVIGSIAHFTPHKNHAFLLDFFKKMTEIDSKYYLVMVGDGKLKGAIEDKAKELGISNNVMFTGTRTDIPELLSAMDIMVLPSLYEGLPCVVIEWQCSGLPSILSDTITKECKMTDLVTFIPLKIDEWVSQIINTENNDKRDIVSQESIEAIKNKGYDIESQANMLKKLYVSKL